MTTRTFKHTAEELRKMAADCRQRSQESWERSDSDGFLSQWANDITAREYEDQARIIDNGGMATFNGLFEGDRRVAAKLIDGQFGLCWLLRDDEAKKFGRKFIPFSRTGRSRVQAALGVEECHELAPAWAKVGVPGNGKKTGLSGCANACVMTFRVGCEWGTDGVRQ